MDEELKIKLLLKFLEFKKNNAADIEIASKQLENGHGYNAGVCSVFLAVALFQLLISYIGFYDKKRDRGSDGWSAYFFASCAAIVLLLLAVIINLTLPNTIFPTPGHLR